MVGSQDVGAVLEDLLMQFDSLVELSRVMVGVGEVVACLERVRVVGSQDAGAVLEDLLE